MTRHKTKDKGDKAVTAVIASLREHNIIPCLPLSEHLPFDLLAVMPDMETMIRLQVKYRESRNNGAILVEFRSNYYDSKRIYSKAVNFDELDAYAVYVADTEQICNFRIEEIPLNASTLTLRFQPSKNNQRKGVNLVGEYLNPLRLANKQGNLSEMEKRLVSFQDEIAVAHAIDWLQKCEIYPHYPTSQYMPFDLVGVLSDMKTVKRYRIGYDKVQFTPFADEFIVYESNLRELMFINPATVNGHPNIIPAVEIAS